MLILSKIKDVYILNTLQPLPLRDEALFLTGLGHVACFDPWKAMGVMSYQFRVWTSVLHALHHPYIPDPKHTLKIME